MGRKSAGILLFKSAGGQLSVLLVHPGGPFWRKRDLGAWSIPKGEYHEDEPPEAAARRECAEEIGMAPKGQLHPLGEARLKGGKIIMAFATESEFDPGALRSNEFSMEWPPRSGQVHVFPEVDRAEWFPLATAYEKINAGQPPFLDRLKVMRAPL